MPTKKTERDTMYARWRDMIRRCHVETSKDFRWYGARGVVVCDRWRASFAAFLEDVGACPSREHTIDRVDSAKGYEPGNVRWATPTEQARNRTNNVRHTIGPESMTAGEWADRVGLPRKLVQDRIKIGWPIEEALRPASPGVRTARPRIVGREELRSRRAAHARAKYAEQKAALGGKSPRAKGATAGARRRAAEGSEER